MIHSVATVAIAQAGFTGDNAILASKVVQAESGGNPASFNNGSCSATGDNAVGLFQICTVHKGTMGIPSNKTAAIAWLKNPLNNAKVAKQLFDTCHGSFDCDWAASKAKWSVGNAPTVTGPAGGGGSGIPIIGGIVDAVTGAVGGAVDTAEGAVSTAGDIANGVGKIAGLLVSPSFYLRVGKGFLGVSLIILGTGALVYVVGSKVNTSNTGSAVKGAAITAAKFVK